MLLSSSFPSVTNYRPVQNYPPSPPRTGVLTKEPAPLISPRRDTVPTARRLCRKGSSCAAPRIIYPEGILDEESSRGKFASTIPSVTSFVMKLPLWETLFIWAKWSSHLSGLRAHRGPNAGVRRFESHPWSELQRVGLCGVRGVEHPPSGPVGLCTLSSSTFAEHKWQSSEMCWWRPFSACV